jgi:type II secretory pathway pseudopilin PulG
VFTRYIKQRGFSIAELIVAMTFLGTLLVVFAVSLDSFARFNRYQLVRQRCIAAAQAELDSISITGKPLLERDFQRLWPGLSVSIKRVEGAGQWQGLELAEVTTSGKSFRHKVQINLSRYVLIK